MLITQKLAQLNVIEQKPVNINLASHPYGSLITGDYYTGGLGVTGVGKKQVVKDCFLQDPGYSGAIRVDRLTRRDVVRVVNNDAKEAYVGIIRVKRLSKKAVVKMLSAGGDVYSGSIAPVSLLKREVVVEHKVDSKDAYSGIVRIVRFSKEEV